MSSSQSQVLYSQHHPIPLRNLQQQKHQNHSNNYEKTNEIGLHLISQPGSNLINHPNFYNQFSNRPISPTKSNSINEISPFAHHHKQGTRSNGNSQQSGVVVYYSPEESSSLMITDLDTVGNKFTASETELQKLKEHLVYKPDSCGINNHQKSNSSSKKYFFSKRPVSFKKALEITEQLDRNSLHNVPNNSNASNNNNSIKSGTKANTGNDGTKLDSNKDENRHSQYEMNYDNYEISV